MPLSDQQLRQELAKYGENVPPITQRNRDHFQARLEVLRAQPRSRVSGSPSRTRGSPATTTTTAAAAAAAPSRPSTRSRPVPGLIELSDSETDTAPGDYLLTRSVGTGATRPAVQTRSIHLRRPYESSSPLSTSDIPGPTNMTHDVEQSIARHRREIQQLIDSARDRTRAVSSGLAAGQPGASSATTPLRPNSSSASRSRFDQERSQRQQSKPRGPSWFNRWGNGIRSFWKHYKKIIKEILKALLVGAIIGGALIFLKNKGGDLFPRHRGINCSAENATYCPDMQPVIAAVQKQLQIRTGEVECGFRPPKDVLVARPEISRYLDEKGLKFELGDNERWDALLHYIKEKPVDDIIFWNKQNQKTNSTNEAFKLSTQEAIRSLSCRTRQGVSTALQNLGLLLLGSTGLLTLAWYLRRRSKQHEDNEKTYNDFLQKIFDLLQNQYEEHIQDPNAKPWLAISHIRDMLVPPEDRQRLKAIWERAKKHISEQESRVRSEAQLIHGEEFDVWRWIQPKLSSSPSSPRKNKQRSESPNASGSEDSYVYMPANVGLTECLKLRHFFSSDNCADDDEIDLVVDSIQKRCASVRRIEHIGIHSVYVYLKFSSKDAAAQGFHLLNNWKYNGRDIVAKYLRLERYHEHFPEARDSGNTSN